MYYKLLLFILPVPVVVYLWNSGDVNIDTEIKTLFSVMLLLLTIGGYLDVYRNDWSTEDDQ